MKQKSFIYLKFQNSSGHWPVMVLLLAALFDLDSTLKSIASSNQWDSVPHRQKRLLFFPLFFLSTYTFLCTQCGSLHLYVSEWDVELGEWMNVSRGCAKPIPSQTDSAHSGFLACCPEILLLTQCCVWKLPSLNTTTSARVLLLSLLWLSSLLLLLLLLSLSCLWF